jgi:hypothetical protein
LRYLCGNAHFDLAMRNGAIRVITEKRGEEKRGEMYSASGEGNSVAFDAAEMLRGIERYA